MYRHATLCLGLLLAGFPFLSSRHAATAQDSRLERVKYNHPGLVVVIGVEDGHFYYLRNQRAKQ